MAGTQVILIEAGRIASEASGRNGGQCNNGIAGDFAALSARFGPQRATDLYRAFDAGVDRVEAIVKEEAIACDFTRNGKLKLADKPDHAVKLARSAELLAQTVEPDIRLLDRNQLAGKSAPMPSMAGWSSRAAPPSIWAASPRGCAPRPLRCQAMNTPLTGLSQVPGGRHEAGHAARYDRTG
jgi:glycine/D-amino acid oxidase-like deaminating enzyme